MGAAEILAESTEPAWLIRAYEPGPDEDDSLCDLLGQAYTRSRAGVRAGAAPLRHVPEMKLDPVQRRRDEQEHALRKQAFMATHVPIWNWLLANADVRLACDPGEPRIIWAWAITSGADVVHAVGAKRSVCDAKLAADVVGDLLGDRLRKHQVCSLELPQMRSRSGGAGAIGLDRPREWSIDPTWLLTRMGSR